MAFEVLKLVERHIYKKQKRMILCGWCIERKLILVVGWLVYMFLLNCRWEQQRYIQSVGFSQMASVNSDCRGSVDSDCSVQSCQPIGQCGFGLQCLVLPANWAVWIQTRAVWIQTVVFACQPNGAVWIQTRAVWIQTAVSVCQPNGAVWIHTGQPIT